MSEAEIMKLITISGSVFLATVVIFLAGGLLAVIVAATLTDAVLRQIEARRAIPLPHEDSEKF